MKQELKDEDRQALIKYRIERSKATLVEADIMTASKCYNAAINRFYYACYYAVVALLLKHRISAHTHDGVKQQFGLHFGVNGLIDKKYTRFFARLFNDRITGDYDDFIQYDEETITLLRPQVEEFLNVVTSLVE